ncbi:MAG: hypothetical protein LBT91_03350 [Bifidobacteriaceae bacterium]|jgi:hypothetical protein|nr:hypothetical protein [Bifidobacteriaceae bacterium]
MAYLTSEIINQEKLYNITLKPEISVFRVNKSSISVGYSPKTGLEIKDLSFTEQEYIKSLFYNSCASSAKRKLLKRIDEDRFRHIEKILNKFSYLEKNSGLDERKTSLTGKTIAINSADRFGASIIVGLIDAGVKNIIIYDKNNVLVTDIGPVYSENNVGLPRLKAISKYLRARYKNIKLHEQYKGYIDLFIVIDRFKFNYDFSTELKQNNIDHIVINLKDCDSIISPILSSENNLCLKCHIPSFYKNSLFKEKIDYRYCDSVYLCTEKIYTLSGFIVSQIKMLFSGISPNIENSCILFTNLGSNIKIDKINKDTKCLCALY